VGGVWRDNQYPGAACDVPSHLYSFSFEPKPDWSHVFARQGEIHGYLQHCAHKYALSPHIRFGVEMQSASYDEARACWVVLGTQGEHFEARILITALGQLSRPAMPRIEGLSDFQGHTFHSARWDHQYHLQGKRVAVVGTGASAIQFIPEIARQVAQLTVFQRSAAYMLPRPDRAYSPMEKSWFGRLPLLARLYRLGIYLQYESRALAFTRLQWLMQPLGAVPFRRMLQRQVPDATLRSHLTPDYPIGCKRILLSSNYLTTFTQPHVTLCTDGIRRITATGIETADGQHHAVDTIVFGTGFAATEFLAPMRITGRQGKDLHADWNAIGGAQAYLGMTVPGFPNFFMLYGPNTNLGHNSIIYMLESQIAHVARCLRAMQAQQASTIEVREAPFRAFNVQVQQHLGHSIWQGCNSWYLDANGRNTTNWSGFTLSYRWKTRWGSLDAYRLAQTLPGAGGAMETVLPPTGLVERMQATLLRGFLRTAFRSLIGPPTPARVQRRWVEVLALLMPARSGVTTTRILAGSVPVQVTSPTGEARDTSAAVLYLHGGAFCLGSPFTHRSITSHMAHAGNLAVWTPDYRLAPEYPYPAALQDALSTYQTMVQQGIAPERIVVAGDSAGGSLALALAITLRDQGQPLPAALALISPVTDPLLQGASLNGLQHADPMIRRGWVKQGVAWYACPAGTAAHTPLQTDLRGLPPMLVQVGSDEVLYSDSERLTQHARACGVPCTLEVYQGRWHVFHLQALFLRSSVHALQTLAQFARARIVNTPKVTP
jgi:cation diffusion facilitator CzcD-associated flavoprotein CzcO/acetyl esterase/lipase